jgi:ethanolamine ammonia-lyase small subunit
MLDQERIEEIVRAVLKNIQNSDVLQKKDAALPEKKEEEEELLDLTSRENKEQITLKHMENPEMMQQMKTKTPARIGVGKAGARLRTQTYLTLRADHAGARDAVFRDVDPKLLEELDLFQIQSMCQSRNEHLTRPDLGRVLGEEAKKELLEKCKKSPRVQIYLSDGLSSQAIEANARDILPSLMDGLEGLGIDTGTPFYVRFGRVPTMDVISELLDAEVTCVLIGERPGLATANSMSAYISYRAAVGMPESRRTVVSNIHDGGIPAVEAGAHIAQLIKIMLERKKSGVELQL